MSETAESPGKYIQAARKPDAVKSHKIGIKGVSGLGFSGWTLYTQA